MEKLRHIFADTDVEWLSFVVSFVGLRPQTIDQSNLFATVINNGSAMLLHPEAERARRALMQC